MTIVVSLSIRTSADIFLFSEPSAKPLNWQQSKPTNNIKTYFFISELVMEGYQATPPDSLLAYNFDKANLSGQKKRVSFTSKP